MHRIIFYQPKSFAASFLGVSLKIVLAILPLALVLIIRSYQNEEISIVWAGLALVLGIFLGIKSDVFISPLIGERHEFLFDTDSRELIIKTKSSKEHFKFEQLQSIRAFAVPLDGSEIKHLVLTWEDGRKIDIFETWLANESSRDFYSLYEMFLSIGEEK